MIRVFTGLWFGLAACGGARTEPPAESVAIKSEPVAAPAVTASSQGVSKTLVGTLRFTEAPMTMSLEAYNHVPFRLEVDGGASEALSSTAAVSDEALKALDGKRVEVEVTWEEPQAPSDNEAHPIDPMTGEGEKRPGRWLVSKVHEVGG